MKLTKINLSELANADLNEREMCRLLGGSGCCQCGCHYTATTATNDSFNDKDDLTSDPGAQPCNCSTPAPPPPPYPQKDCYCQPMDGTKVDSITMCGKLP